MVASVFVGGTGGIRKSNVLIKYLELVHFVAFFRLQIGSVLMSNLFDSSISGASDVKTYRYASGGGNHVLHCPISCFYQTTKTLSS